MSRELPQTSVIGAAGEHLVLSHLLKNNFVAGTAPYNTKDYDLVVLSKDGAASSPIQVKTAMQHKKSGATDGWILRDKHEIALPNLIFCFVRMYLDSDHSEIHIIDSKTVAYAAKLSHQIWLKLPGLKGRPHKDTAMRQLMHDYRKISGIKNNPNLKDYLNTEELKFLNDYSLGWMDKYKDNWSLI